MSSQACSYMHFSADLSNDIVASHLLSHLICDYVAYLTHGRLISYVVM